MTQLDYFDRDGNPVTRDEFAVLFDDFDYRRVAETQVGRTLISTVWVGARGFCELTYETMIFTLGGLRPLDQWQLRSRSESEARAVHAICVSYVSGGGTEVADLEALLMAAEL